MRRLMQKVSHILQCFQIFSIYFEGMYNLNSKIMMLKENFMVCLVENFELYVFAFTD